MAVRNRNNVKELVAAGKKLNLPGGIVTGLILGTILGAGTMKGLDESFYRNKTIFPEMAGKTEVIDGDTFIMSNGLSVRLLGIDAPNRGEPKYEEAASALEKMISGQLVWLEYDRYQIDQFGRVLVWAWIGCTSPWVDMAQPNPKFLPANYMVKSKNRSNPGLAENPEGCGKGKLVNEEMIKAGLAKTVKYGDRGEMKYEERLAKSRVGR